MIKVCAQLCSASYDDSAPGFVTVGDLRYGVFQIEDKTVIVIRGTANVENWLRDADAWPKRSCGGYLAHSGFVDAYRQLCAGGMPTVRGNIIATGHSLGGAIATLLAEHIGCKLVTFGSPRVYWRFGGAPQIDHTRVVRDDDPVPRIPQFCYSHRCDPVMLNDDDRLLVQIGDHFIAGYVKVLEAYHDLVD